MGSSRWFCLQLLTRLQSRCQSELQLSEGLTAAGRTHSSGGSVTQQQAGAASPCRPLCAAWASSGRGGCLSTVSSSRKQAQAAEPQASHFVNPIMFYWRRKWHPTPVIFPGEFHGQRSLAGYSPWGCKEPGMTEQLSLTHIYIHTHIDISFSIIEDILANLCSFKSIFNILICFVKW